MRIMDAFPSKYLKPADLRGRTVPLMVKRFAMENMRGGKKPVIYFEKTDKGLVLNKTQAKMITNLLGDETDDWMGKEIAIYPTMVDFQGRPTETIGVKGPPPRAVSSAPSQASA
jgi:hypothetical protein